MAVEYKRILHTYIRQRGVKILHRIGIVEQRKISRTVRALRNDRLGVRSKEINGSSAYSERRQLIEQQRTAGGTEVFKLLIMQYGAAGERYGHSRASE